MRSTRTTSMPSWNSLPTTARWTCLVDRSPGVNASRAKRPYEKGWLCAQGLPDVHYGDDRHWVSGNMGVSEWSLTGTTPDGVRIHVRGCDHWEFRDGRVIRKDSYWKIVDK